MKKLANLKDAKALHKKEQLSIKGGWGCPGSCTTDADCEPCNDVTFFPVSYSCYHNICQETI